jgi:ankyrin repeat protein
MLPILTIVAFVISATFVAAREQRLTDAVKHQDGRAVRALLQQKKDVNAPEPDGTTALHWAAHQNDLETVSLLLKAGARVNATTSQGITPLALACENGSAAIVAVLLDRGADVNLSDAAGQTPLMIAARTGNPDVVKSLLAHGARVNAVTRELGQSALAWAISERHRQIVKTLIEAGADVIKGSTRGFTPLMFAAQQGDVETGRLLVDAGAPVNQTALDGTHPLPLAIVSGKAAFALFLLDRGADANATIHGVSACQVCILSKDEATTAISALHAAVDENGTYVTKGRLTPKERRDLVSALLAHGADPNGRATAFGGIGYAHDPKNEAHDEFGLGVGSRRGATAFWIAASNANIDLMRLLRAGGGDPTLTPVCRSTALMVASGLGQYAFNILYTPVQQAATRPKLLDAVKYLVEEVGADVNAVNEAGFTALHGAAYVGGDAIAQYLVAHGAKLNAQDYKGRTPFRIAQGTKVVTEFHRWTSTADVLRALGADTSLGVDGEILEREAGQARDRR